MQDCLRRISIGLLGLGLAAATGCATLPAPYYAAAKQPADLPAEPAVELAAAEPVEAAPAAQEQPQAIIRGQQAGPQPGQQLDWGGGAANHEPDQYDPASPAAPGAAGARPAQTRTAAAPAEGGQVQPAQFTTGGVNDGVGRFHPPARGGNAYTLPGPPIQGGPVIGGPPGAVYQEPATYIPLDIFADETRTGRFMFGVGVNSDTDVTGQITIDERNFDLTAIPTTFDDWMDGRAFRGAGQGFRLEALPGSQLERYMINFTEPYLFDTPISLNLSGFFYERRFFDWDEQRFGGRMALGYRLTHDLSLSLGLRGEQVDLRNPRVATVPEVANALGESDLFSSSIALIHDTRDTPFAATEGHYFQVKYEQVFGSFDYPRGEIDYRTYYLLNQRPDGSGRHTLSYSFRAGFSGSQTPVYENFFAGGHATLRGFDFRGASPKNQGVTVGGEFMFLGSVEYMFPLTADDMMKGVAFCDFGTVEEKISISGDDYRVAPGVGMRIFVPALGPAPIALDFAFPVASSMGDDEQVFSFFIGLNR